MKGTVIGFDPDLNAGAIIGDDGKRYDFDRQDWRGPARPARETVVEFIPAGIQATHIDPLAIRHDPGDGGTATTVYILYLVGIIIGITSIIGLIIASANRGGAPDWVKTHYRYQICTFWIGLLYGLISLVTSFMTFGFLLGLFTFVWWIGRCAKGLSLVSRGEPCDNAATWLW